MTHARTVAIVAGSERPVSIAYFEPLAPGDSGFSVICEDVDPDDDVDADDTGSELVCLACLIDERPEIGRGLDLAREHGIASLDEHGEWVVGDRRRG